MELSNSNPIVLDQADLPGHRPRRTKVAAVQDPADAFTQLLDLSRGFRLDPFYASDVEGDSTEDEEDEGIQPIDEQEVYDLIALIEDPEHPLSLESLGVVKIADIHLTATDLITTGISSTPFSSDTTNETSSTSPTPSLSLSTATSSTLTRVLVELTPTVTHCSLATVIGLGVRVRLEQALPPSYRVEVRIKAGTHSQADEVNKQLADKERVAAALENESLMSIIRKMLRTCVDD